MSSTEESSTKPDPGVLRLKSQNEEDNIASPFAAKEPQPKRSKRKKKKQQDSLEEPKTPGSKARLRFIMISLVPFIFSVAIMGTWLAHQILDWQLITKEQALFARNILVLSFFVVMVIEAFTEDVLQGVLCLFIAPYAIMYGIFVSDAGAIRGLTVAILCFLGAEMFIQETKEDALVPLLEEQVNSFIHTNQRKLLDPYDD